MKFYAWLSLALALGLALAQDPLTEVDEINEIDEDTLVSGSGSDSNSGQIIEEETVIDENSNGASNGYVPAVEEVTEVVELPSNPPTGSFPLIGSLIGGILGQLGQLVPTFGQNNYDNSVVEEETTIIEDTPSGSTDDGPTEVVEDVIEESSEQLEDQQDQADPNRRRKRSVDASTLAEDLSKIQKDLSGNFQALAKRLVEDVHKQLQNVRQLIGSGKKERKPSGQTSVQAESIESPAVGPKSQSAERRRR